MIQLGFEESYWLLAEMAATIREGEERPLLLTP